MDRIVQKIHELSVEVSEKGIEGGDREELKKRVADSIIVSYGARNSVPVRIAVEALGHHRSGMEAPIYFSGSMVSVEAAAFINGGMTRYLDFNDTYLSKEALHPSDNIPPLIAVGYAMSLGGEELLRASYVSYQVVGALSDAVSIRDRGWDHVTYISVSSAAGIANLMGLTEERFENALSLGINNNISMRQTRAGELSMWKGFTAANACRNSVFAALLAQKGFTGPSHIFTGEMGFFKQVSGEFDLDLSVDRVPRTMIKNYPVEYHAMSAAEAADELRKEIRGDIESVSVDTFRVAHTIIIKDPEKLRPRTKETADHSMPYIIAYTLLHGAPGLDAYDDRYLRDQAILDLIDRMKFNVTEKYNSMYPEYLPVRIEVRTDRGTWSKEVDAPKGHFRRPYTWDDLQEKGRRVMGEDRAREVIGVCRDLERRSIRELMEVVKSVGP